MSIETAADKYPHRGAILDALNNINFEGFDTDNVSKISYEMETLIEKNKMTDKEVKEFIGIVVKNLNGLSKYIENVPPTEIAQSLVSLLTTGTLGHFFKVLPGSKEEEFIKSLPSIAAQVKEKTLKEEIEKN